nr:MAG TPA: hypothetical protein [Caudoviricetes sp.]
MNLSIGIPYKFHFDFSTLVFSKSTDNWTGDVVYAR